MSINRWMGKEYLAYIYNAILPTIKKNENFVIWGNMVGLKGHYAKWNKSEKDKYCMISLYLKSKKFNKLVNLNRKNS